MMRIRIYSWFNSRNIGDILIAQSISDIFSDYGVCEYYDITSGQSVEHPTLLFPGSNCGGIKNKILNNVVLRNGIDFIYAFKGNKIQPYKGVRHECDLAVFAGGNSLMDIEPFLPSESIVTYRRIKELKRQGVRIIYCFSGVGPYVNPISSIFARKTLQEIDFISVRDNASYELCKQLGRSDYLEIWRDPVLMLSPTISEKKKDTIAINVYFGSDYRLKEKMRDSYVNLVKSVREKYPDMKITLFATDTGDVADVDCIIEKVSQENGISIKEIKNEADLFDLYSESCIMFGMRMHSLITAVISGVQIVAVGWQKKVEALMEYLELEDRLVTQGSFCEDYHVVLPLISRAFENQEDKNTNRILKAEKESFEENFLAFWKKWGDK